MTDSRLVMEQYNELLERFQAYFEKHNKEELTLVNFGSHLRIEKSLRAQDSDKPKGNNVVGPQRFWFQELNIANDIGNSAFMSTFKLNDSIIWHARLGHVHFKRMQDMSKDGLIPAFDMNTEKCKTCMLNKITKKPFQNIKCETKVLELIHNDLCDLHVTPSLRNKKYFVTFIDDASRTKPRVLGAVVKLPDPKLKFLVPRLSFRIPNKTEDIGGLVVPQEVAEEVVQQPKPELRKSKRNRT
ncbi:zinc finger, CCHC-type containing protein [Tanacetum coccineum]